MFRHLRRSGRLLQTVTLKPKAGMPMSFSPLVAPQRAAVVRLMSTKSWVPQTEDALQNTTIQALIHEVSVQQMESAQNTVPWFLKNMPVRNCERRISLSEFFCVY